MATSRVLAAAAAMLLAGAVMAEAQQVSSKAKRNRNLITTEEIEQSGANTAYQVVERLHPEYFRQMTRPRTIGGGMLARGSAGGRSTGAAGGGGAGAGTGDPMQDQGPAYSEVQARPTAAVFMDGTEMGGLEELQNVQSNLVEEIRYLSGPDAEQKYGPRFSSGVIEVKLKNH